MEGISYQASKMGFGLEVESSNGSTEKERQIIERMFNSGVQGVILYPYLRLSESEEYLNKEFTHPIVIVDLYQPSMRRPSVVFDNFSAGCDITNYLIGQGKRRIAFLRFPQSFYISIDERCRGYLRALENFGISYNPDHVIEFIDEHWPFKTSVVNLNKAILQLVQGTCVPDAIILPSETYIAEVRDILSSVGITQDQISIVGFDNILSRDAEDNYVSTSPNFPYMGERACQLLAEIIATKKSDCSCLTLPCPIVYGKQAIGKRAIDDLYLHAHGIKANYGNLSRDLD
jgi:LacI family transcriptional regulator